MRFICLLRGINVSGKRLIKMEDIREIFNKMGFSGIETYIQSGNIILDSFENDEAKLIDQIEKEFLLKLGYPITSFIRDFNEWENIALNNPFQDEFSNNFKYYVTFFNVEPEKLLQNKLLEFCNINETYAFYGRAMYSRINKDPVGKVIFTNNFVESKLKIPSTTRNWNTIVKLLDYKNRKYA